MRAPDDRPAPVDAAIAFVAAQPGGPERLLRRHRGSSSGLCTGCLTQPTRYPCQVARIALNAQARAPEPKHRPKPSPTTPVRLVRAARIHQARRRETMCKGHRRRY
jgi:hypothetical protein